MLSGLQRRRIHRVRAKEPDGSDRRPDQGAAVGAQGIKQYGLVRIETQFFY